MGSAGGFGTINNNVPLSDREAFSQYSILLDAIEKEHCIKLSHEVRRLNAEFFGICFLYTGNLNWMQDYLRENDFEMVYNIGMIKLDEIIEKEKDKIVRGEYLLGGYFNSSKELSRYIIGKKEILLTKIFNKVKKGVENLSQIPCRH